MTYTSKSPRCHWCGGYAGLIRVRMLGGASGFACRDGALCLRKKMHADGIKLLPHPKNLAGA